ncbi:MAG: hypothetical protein G01um101470_553 [Parcubacteria group bacterium Gr01-1014_70]|nr:MAG: hypothetical protein G01um101470_553 [Parcubacteria group bacterium Gr01-1014_70]
MRTVEEIMTKNVVSVPPDMLLCEAVRIIMENDFDGVPVLENGMLVGILTQYDLISKGTALHLPTMQYMLERIPVDKKDKAEFREKLKDVLNLCVRDLMNPEPLVFQAGDTYEHAVKTFRDHHRVNPIPVVDDTHHVIGIVSRYDILKLFEEI